MRGKQSNNEVKPLPELGRAGSPKERLGNCLQLERHENSALVLQSNTLNQCERMRLHAKLPSKERTSSFFLSITRIVICREL